MREIPLLAGKTLGCWCKPNPCHRDVLVKLVQEYLEKKEVKSLSDVDHSCVSEVSEGVLSNLLWKE